MLESSYVRVLVIVSNASLPPKSFSYEKYRVTHVRIEMKKKKCVLIFARCDARTRAYASDVRHYVICVQVASSTSRNISSIFCFCFFAVIVVAQFFPMHERLVFATRRPSIYDLTRLRFEFISFFVISGDLCSSTKSKMKR